MNTDQALSRRVHLYHSKLKRYWGFSELVGHPRFNVTHNASFYKAYLELGDFLKTEADALWAAGVSVYY